MTEKPKIIQKTKSIRYVSLEEEIQKLWKSRGFTEIIEEFHAESDKYIWKITAKTKSFRHVSLEEQIQKLWKSRGLTEIIGEFHTEADRYIWKITAKRQK